MRRASLETNRGRSESENRYDTITVTSSLAFPQRSLGNELPIVLRGGCTFPPWNLAHKTREFVSMHLLSQAPQPGFNGP